VFVEFSVAAALAYSFDYACVGKFDEHTMQRKAGSMRLIDDGVHGVLDSEADVAELAEEVHVEDVIEEASESVDIPGVRGQEIGSWNLPLALPPNATG
jgi:hypothetical protein